MLRTDSMVQGVLETNTHLLNCQSDIKKFLKTNITHIDFAPLFKIPTSKANEMRYIYICVCVYYIYI